MPLNEFLQREVATVGPSATLAEAARLMVEQSVGALVVVDPLTLQPVGIVTDRDLVARMAEGHDPESATVSACGEAPLETAHVGESIHDVTHRMRKRGIRRLPIVSAEGALLGIISLDDVLRRLACELGDIAQAVETEIRNERARHAASRTGRAPESPPAARPGARSPAG